MMELKKVDRGNLEAMLSLEVDKGQESFVAPNVVSLAEAYVAVTSGFAALPFGIYEDGVPVGFVMFGYGQDPESPPVAKNNYCIWRFMIDKAYQHRGLGRKALDICLEYLRTYPCGRAEYCWLSYEPENEKARSLYRSAGFRENGEVCGGEFVSVRKL
ncbi:GNAT family N-acetyltransferase [Neglectibacter timonensis]|uniref:GNAT family N-acetyltransferase n=2 Tax=Neglectibacter timonensis TaxID=1776382 RepID=UPI00266C0E78|nr:GNAT family N-acetyltransferase [Neglectibacter timonensis]